MEVRRLWPGWMVAMVGRDTAGGSDTTIPPGFPFTIRERVIVSKCVLPFCQQLPAPLVESLVSELASS